MLFSSKKVTLEGIIAPFNDIKQKLNEFMKQLQEEHRTNDADIQTLKARQLVVQEEQDKAGAIILNINQLLGLDQGAS